MNVRTFFLFILLASACASPAASVSAQESTTPDNPSFKAGEAIRDNGVLVHAVESACQDAPTRIRVLLPGKLEKGRRYPVLYVLPVEAGDGHRYGDGLLEVKKLGLHDRYGLVCVAPTFARLPWYADHPTNARVRQETYFLKVVLPFIEKTYPVLARPEGRLLLGFSKSGWGAFSLLLRHPEVFGKAAAWDAPLDMDAPGKYGSGDDLRHAGQLPQVPDHEAPGAAGRQARQRQAAGGAGVRQLPGSPHRRPRPDGPPEDRPRRTGTGRNASTTGIPDG